MLKNDNNNISNNNANNSNNVYDDKIRNNKNIKSRKEKIVLEIFLYSNYI